MAYRRSLRDEWQTYLRIVVSTAFLLAGLPCLLLGITSLLDRDLETARLAIPFGGAFLLLAVVFDRIVSFKGPGFELKAEVEAKINEVDDVLGQLKSLTGLTCETLISLDARAGRFDSASSPRASMALADKVRALMESIDVHDLEMKAAVTPWARQLCATLSRAVTHPLHALLQKESQERRHPDTQREPAAALRWQARIGELGSFSLPDFPDRVLALFDGAPLLPSQDLEDARARMASYADSMRSLATTLVLDASERHRWLAEIDAAKRAGAQL